MKFFDGLYSYEIIMLLLGVLVLLVLLTAFLRLVFRNESFTSLLPFFAVPIIMIGYSSIQSISFQNNIVTINKTVDTLKQDPNNISVRDSLRTYLANASSRPATSANAIGILGRAQLALGDDDEAKKSLAKAEQVDPNASPVKELNQRIQLGDQLKTLTSTVENQPSDSSSKTALQNTVKQLESSGIADPKTLSELASAHAALGNPQRALSVANQALRIDPNLAGAQRIVNRSKITDQQTQTAPQKQ